MKKQILFLLTIIMLLVASPSTVYATTAKVAKPTITVVESNPKDTILLVKGPKGAKIYYNTHGNTPKKSDKQIETGKVANYCFDFIKLEKVCESYQLK